ncbi:hypothetical protein [Acinetobacter defluvii]|uniref:hypothetical protein n=1 Tax=Acinetobacter defluvii TaxID=1871111 RepID=UPI0008245616|nr:hypothetical protein [Acinetobacter defluvii]
MIDNTSILALTDIIQLPEAERLQAIKDKFSAKSHDELHCKGMVILCGYEHPIYEALKWKKIKKSVAAAGQSGSVQREEVLWINPQAENQQDLFSEVV